MRTITVEVTQADIDEGCRRDGNNCPIAKAIVRADMENISTANVADEYIDAYRWDGSRVWSAEPPREAQGFMFDFDRRRPVRPFSFTLDVHHD